MSLLQYNSGLAAFRSAAEDEAAMRAAATGSALAVHKVRTMDGWWSHEAAVQPTEHGDPAAFTAVWSSFLLALTLLVLQHDAVAVSMLWWCYTHSSCLSRCSTYSCHTWLPHYLLCPW
jgi:hypothetical protein